MLAETEEDEDDAEPTALLQGEKDRPRQDIKDGDPLAALGDKLAKLRSAFHYIPQILIYTITL